MNARRQVQEHYNVNRKKIDTFLVFVYFFFILLLIL